MAMMNKDAIVSIRMLSVKMQKLVREAKKSHTNCHWWSNESTHDIVTMSPEEDNATIKLNHMVHVVNMPLEFELYVLFRYFFMHVSMVNQDTTNEETF